MIFPFFVIVTFLAKILAVPLTNKLGPKKILFSSVFIMSSCMLIASLLKNFIAFAIIFVMGCGIPVGFLFMVPLKVISRYYLKNKGKAIGLCMTFTGLNAIIM
jgi:MFS family permease